MSVFFEIDGPYRCMVIPASKEENKMLKKRYAVFSHSGKLHEVKGFELKRRGELKIIKIFQEEVFSKFLEGKTLQECYDSCGEVADRWYDILETEGEYIDEQDVIDFIGESRFLSRNLSDYDGQKGTSITCAKRLSEFLGPEIVKDKGLNVKFIISKLPVEAKVADRAIPTAIFETDEAVKKKFLRKWLKNDALQDFDMRKLIDWDYYKERVAGTIMKIVTIPAALQKCMNPVPKIQYPDWLHKRLKAEEAKFKQKDMKFFFQQVSHQEAANNAIRDIEEYATNNIQKLAINSAAQMEVQAAKNAAKEKENKYAKIEDCPSPEEDFGEWLKYQKSNWRKIRKIMKDDKQVISATGASKSKHQGIASFIRNMDDVVLKSNWHVVQVSETFEPGILKLWALTDAGQMFSVKLKVSRTIYINSQVPCNEAEFKKSNKLLPRNRKVLHLYEWDNEESLFQEKFHSIKNQHLLAHTVEGVYETKLPLLFKAIMEIGCIVKPRQQLINKKEQALGRVYKVNELEVKNMEAGSYLPSSAFEKIYIFHVSQGNRHVWGLFIDVQKDITFYIVNPVA